MATLLINIDVDDLEKGIRFYQAALALKPGRRLGPDAREMLGASSPIYLLENQAGSRPFEGGTVGRDYRRHWTPVHLDFAVEDIEAAVARAVSAGATLEGRIEKRRWGLLARLSDPFGNGFCILQFEGRGYDELIDTSSA